MAKVRFLSLILSLTACNPAANPDAPSQGAPGLAVFVGTYTQSLPHVEGQAAGIYTMMPQDSGGWQMAHVREGILNPSYLTVDAGGKFLYAVSEIGPGGADSSGWVGSYRIGSDGSLQPLNRQPTFGFAPCYVSLTPDGQFVMVANYVGGTIAVYPRLGDGKIGAASARMTFTGSGPHREQQSAHPHCIISSPDGQFVYVADKGTDKVMGLALSKAGELTPTEQGALPVAPGAGPRHLVFHSSRPFLYLVNELNGTVNSLSYDATTGQLGLLQTIRTLPESYSGFNACADIHISPDARHLYASNRGHNSLAIYRILENGQLEWLAFQPSGGKFPRNFAITPDGQEVWAANQNTGNIVRFSRNADTGLLTPAGELECPTPVCLKFAEL